MLVVVGDDDDPPRCIDEHSEVSYSIRPAG